jgi:hypothetical protein
LGHCLKTRTDFRVKNPNAVLDERRSAAGLSNAHGDGTSHPFDILKIVDGFFFFVSAVEVNEGEATLTTGLTVEGHRALADFSVLAEQVDQVFPLCVPGEITNENRQKINPKGIPPPFSHIATRIGDMEMSSWGLADIVNKKCRPQNSGTKQNFGDVPFSKNMVCGLVTPERTWTLGHSSSTQGDVAEQNADVMAKPVTVNPVKTTERTTNP